MVAWLKVQLAEMEQEVWTPAELIKGMEAQRREEAAIRRAAAETLEEVRRESPELEEEARAALNAELRAQGIREL